MLTPTQNFYRRWDSSKINHFQVLLISYFVFTWLLPKRRNKKLKTLENDRFQRIPILSNNPVYMSAYFFFWIKEIPDIIWIDYNRTPRATRPNRLLTRHTRINTRHSDPARTFWAESCECRVGARFGRVTMGIRSPSIQAVSCLPPN